MRDASVFGGWVKDAVGQLGEPGVPVARARSSRNCNPLPNGRRPHDPEDSVVEFCGLPPPERGRIALLSMGKRFSDPGEFVGGPR
jgi:hypothetical protein